MLSVNCLGGAGVYLVTRKYVHPSPHARKRM